MPAIDETDPRFYVDSSRIPAAGNGLFAKVPLTQGDRLEIIGVLVERDTVADACSHYADQHKVRVGERLLLIPLGFGGMVNHSAEPNMVKVVEGERAFRGLRRSSALVRGHWFKIGSLVGYPDRAEALEALGLQE